MDYTSLGCCALAFVLYLNTLNTGFVYDDRRAILTNKDVSGSLPWLNAFQNDYWGTPLTDSGSHGSYRPLCVLSFRLNFLLGGYTPWGYHLINNLMHCLATGLVVKLARHFLSCVWGVLATGALFAAHPIHTEAVAGLVGRADLAACIFYLLTFLTYLQHIAWRERDDSRQWFALLTTVLFSLLALLFKETAVTALLVCCIFDFIRGLCSLSDKHRTRSLCILATSLICTLYWRMHVLPRPQTPFSSADNPIAKSGSMWTRFLTFLYLPVFNFKLLLNPQVLSFDWGMDAIPRVNGLFDSRNWLSLGFYGSLTLICYSCCRVLLPKDAKIKSHKVQGSELAADTAYQLQHRTHRKSRAKKKFSNQHQHLPTTMPNYASELSNNTNHSSNSSNNNNNNNNNSQTVPYFVSCICRHCKHDMASGTTQQQHNNINNNNNNNCNNFNNNNYISDCCCHQLLSTGNVTQPSTLYTLHKSNALITSRSSRSSSSCSNSTTASQKSNTSSCSSISSTSSTGYGLYCHAFSTQDLLLRRMPQHTRSAYVLLMALSFLILPFLPATNIFFYVGFVVAERLLYLPSVGYCLLVGVGIAKLREFLGDSEHVRKRKIALAICCSVVLSLLSARTVYRNSDWRDDESLYRSAIEVNPPKALGNLGSVMSSQGRYEEAKEALLLALKYRPNMADAHYNLGILYQNQEFYKQAVESFRRAIQYRPNLAIAYVNLGSSLISLGKCQEAANILQKATKLEGVGVRDRTTHDNARISAYLQLGALYAGQGKLQRALAIYREALHTLPHLLYQRDVLYNRIGDIFGRQQQWAEAEKYHRAALQLQPNQVAAHLSYGITLSRNHSRASEAEMWFKRALKLAPQDSSVLHHYAEFLSSQSRAEEALIYRLTAAELTPNDYSLVVAAATALRLLDRKPEAETWYRKAVALRPKDAHAHTNLGAILHLMGRTNSAAASYKEALRLQPGDPTTLENLTKLGIHAGEIK